VAHGAGLGCDHNYVVAHRDAIARALWPDTNRSPDERAMKLHLHCRFCIINYSVSVALVA
jgi:hypothetical protein